VTWDNVASSCWSIGELCSGITCACLPTLRPFIARFIPSMGSRTGGSVTGPRKYYYGSSGGRDVSVNTSRIRGGTGNNSRVVGDETASARGIIYPEDVELQSDTGSDKDKDVRVHTRPTDRSSPSELERGNADYHRFDRPRFGLGVKPSVRTEVGVGSPNNVTPWQASEGKIQVKTDFIVTTGR
jgi:hypothetical protein